MFGLIMKPKVCSVQNFLIHHNSFWQSRDMPTFLQGGEIRIVPLFVLMVQCSQYKDTTAFAENISIILTNKRFLGAYWYQQIAMTFLYPLIPNQVPLFFLRCHSDVICDVIIPKTIKNVLKCQKASIFCHFGVKCGFCCVNGY